MLTSPRRSDIRRDLPYKSLKHFQCTFHWMILRRFKWYYMKSTGKTPCWNLLTKKNKNMELHISCLEMGTLSQTTMILLKYPFIQHIFIMTPGDFFIIIIERNKTPLVKGRRRRELNISHMYDCAVTAELHVGLGYKASCGHGSRTWQLTQQAACPSFARNHWLE